MRSEQEMMALIQDIDANDTNPFRYCGEWWDKQTKRLYLRARDYDAATGRFTSEDPIGAGQNWYTYCENDPITWIDPSGNSPWKSVSDFLHDLQSDEFGRIILWNWLFGGGKDLNYNDENINWKKYMMDNEELRDKVAKIVKS